MNYHVKIFNQVARKILYSLLARQSTNPINSFIPKISIHKCVMTFIFSFK